MGCFLKLIKVMLIWIWLLWDWIIIFIAGVYVIIWFVCWFCTGGMLIALKISENWQRAD